MLRKYCMEHNKDWDRGGPFLLFATRDIPQRNLGFSPNKFVSRYRVRGPLSVVKNSWSCDPKTSVGLLSYVQDFKTCLGEDLEMSQQNLRAVQSKTKPWYDRRAKQQEFNVGDKVLALLHLQGQPLSARV